MWRRLPATSSRSTRWTSDHCWESRWSTSTPEVCSPDGTYSKAHAQATSRTAACFIDALLQRMPFLVRASQVYRGSEFENLFEAECRRRGIRLLVLPCRSPKLNGHVARAHRTHTEECYEVTDSSFDSTELNTALRQCELIHDTARPQQSLGCLTLISLRSGAIPTGRRRIVTSHMDEDVALTKNGHFCTFRWCQPREV
jgi:hypothetical protein